MAATNRRAGRPGKGERRLLAFRLATPRADIARDLAQAEGFEYVSDWLAHIVNEHIDNTDLSKIQHQEELPISLAS